MEQMGFIDVNSWAFIWIILPLAIFFARIADQTIGTLRLIFVSKGFKYLAPVLGFFEVIIWILAISQIMKHLDNAMCYIAYGLGFAMGNYLGILIEERLSIGTVLIRVIPKKDTTELINYLSGHGYGLTTMDAVGVKGKVKVIMSITQRKNIPEVVETINRFNPNAFYTIEDVRAVKKDVLKSSGKKSIFNSLSFRLIKFK